MALLLPANLLVLKLSLKLAILAELQAHGWGQGGPPSEGTEQGNADVAPTQIQLDLAESIANAVGNTVPLFISQYGEVTGFDTDPAIPSTHVGGGTPPFVPPVIS